MGLDPHASTDGLALQVHLLVDLYFCSWYVGFTVPDNNRHKVIIIKIHSPEFVTRIIYSVNAFLAGMASSVWITKFEMV